MPAGVARPPQAYTSSANGVGGDLRGESRTERAATSIPSPVGTDQDVDNIVFTPRLLEHCQSRCDHFALVHGKLCPLEGGAAGRPAVTDDAAEPIVRGGYQSLKTHPGDAGGLSQGRKPNVLVQVAQPRKRPLD